jgi:glycosyltransferase involved in cell wall biosynthesis
VVVDASDTPLSQAALRQAHPTLTITCLTCPPSVCAQRNLGIRRARGSHVLLLDDDVEPPPDYVARLAAHLEAHPSDGAVSGLVVEPDEGGAFPDGFETPSVRHLLYAFIFQLTVWGDVYATRANAVTALPLALLRRWYRRRGNTWSLGGWPLVTQVREPVVHTAIYGLGATLVRRAWLLASPYAERLGAHGIGDNYGVALGFPDERGIVVLPDLPVRHHRVGENRLDAAEAHFRRVLALDYFLRSDARFSDLNVVFLAWSLVGNAIRFGLRGDHGLLRHTLRALPLVCLGRNPLLRRP